MASFGDIFERVWEIIGIMIKIILWVVGIFYLLPVVSVLIFDFFEFVMLGDFTLSKFNWIHAIQKVHNSYSQFFFLVKSQVLRMKLH